MKINIQKIKLFWKKLKKQWTNHFYFIIRKEKNLSIVFSLKLTPRRIFVLGTFIFFLIFLFTVMLIAFTPLRVYVPGYTNPMEYKLYKKMLIRVDSIEKANTMQKVYLDNFYNVLNNLVISKDLDAPPLESTSSKRVSDKERAEKAYRQINDEAEQILIEITDRTTKSYIPLVQQIVSPTFSFTMPALGIITKQFSIQDRHFGIDLENQQGTLITAIADGVVISTETSKDEGNILVIQHNGNMVSFYKNVDRFFKNKGAKVKSGDPIATMGNRGIESKKPYLHFEIWYNGAPLNPLDYFITLQY